MNQYDDTNRGALFTAADLQIFRRGKVNVEGTERNVMIVQGTSKSGERYFSLYEQVGTVNANKNKKSEKSPDMIGDMDTRDKGLYTIFGYKRQSRNGLDYTQVSIALKEDQNPQQKAATIDSNSFDDNSPF